MTSTATPLPQPNAWWIFLLQGIAAIILGLMFLTAPGATLVASVTFLGFYWVITGLLSLVRIFADKSVPWIWSLLIGVVGLFAGLFIVRHPLLAAVTVPATLVLILGVQGLAIGVFEIIGGFSGGGMGSFILGVVNALVGVLLLSAPLVAALAAPFVFGVLLLVQGIALIVWAFRIRA